jgi:hypothetical protein
MHHPEADQPEPLSSCCLGFHEIDCINIFLFHICHGLTPIDCVESECCDCILKIFLNMRRDMAVGFLPFWYLLHHGEFFLSEQRAYNVETQ